MDKYDAVRFTNQTRRPANYLELSGGRLPKQVKYLGVTLEQRLTFNTQYQFVKLKVNKLKNILLPLLGRRSALDLSRKLLVYTAIIRHIISYGRLSLIFMSSTHF